MLLSPLQCKHVYLAAKSVSESENFPNFLKDCEPSLRLPAFGFFNREEVKNYSHFVQQQIIDLAESNDQVKQQFALKLFRKLHQPVEEFFTNSERK